MKKSRFTEEQMVAMLREAAVPRALDLAVLARDVQPLAGFEHAIGSGRLRFGSLGREHGLGQE